MSHDFQPIGEVEDKPPKRVRLPVLPTEGELVEDGPVCRVKVRIGEYWPTIEIARELVAR